MRNQLSSRLRTLELIKHCSSSVTQEQIDEAAAIIEKVRQEPVTDPGEYLKAWQAIEAEAYKKYGGGGRKKIIELKG